MRRAIFSHSQIEDSFSFGPGTDLIFSLMSVVLLALIIGGILYSTELERLYRENEDYKIALKNVVDWDKYELAKRELEELEALVALLKARVAELEKSMDREPRGLWSLDEASYFNQGDAQLLPEGKRLLSLHIHDIKDKLKLGQANQIKIVGYASPEPRSFSVGEDRNLNLSADRAVAVAHHLNDLGISYDCMYIVGFGRGRSRILHDWLKKDDGRSIRSWDRLKPYNKALIANRLKTERKVLIYAVFDKESECKCNF